MSDTNSKDPSLDEILEHGMPTDYLNNPKVTVWSKQEVKAALEAHYQAKIVEAERLARVSEQKLVGIWLAHSQDETAVQQHLHRITELSNKRGVENG